MLWRRVVPKKSRRARQKNPSVARPLDTLGTHYAAFCRNGVFAGAGPKDAAETHCSGSFAGPYTVVNRPLNPSYTAVGGKLPDSEFACMQSRMPPRHCAAVLPDAVPSILVAVSGSLVRHFCR